MEKVNIPTLMPISFIAVKVLKTSAKFVETQTRRIKSKAVCCVTLGLIHVM